MISEEERDYNQKITWINRFYIDYDDVKLNNIYKDMKILFKLYPSCVVELYATGTPRHKTAVVRNIDITLRDAISFITLSHCSREYVKLVVVREAFFMRVSPKYVSFRNCAGTIVVPQPKLIRIYHYKGDKVIFDNYKNGRE